MRNPTSGSHCPSCSFTWAIANQAIGASGVYFPAHIACPGASPTNGPVLVGARTALPRTAAGSGVVFEAYSDAAGFLTLVITNPAAGAIVALGTDVVLDLIQLPVQP